MPALLAIVLAMGSVSLDDPPAHDEGLLGTWVIVSVEYNGETPNELVYKGSTLVFEKDKFSTSRNGQVNGGGTYTVTTKTSPKRIDRTFTSGPASGRTQSGIYEIKDDTLRLCVSFGTSPRPKEFETHNGSGTVYWVYKRMKEAKKPNAP